MIEIDKEQIIWELRRSEHHRETSVPLSIVCGRAADYIDELRNEIKNLQYMITANRMEDQLAETYGRNNDVITELMAKVGKTDIMLRADRFIELPEEIDILSIEDHRLKMDENHLIIVYTDSEPRRLVFDYFFGWLWYNAEGPEE